MKRLLDIMVSLVALTLFLPFGLVIALVLRLTGEGEIFYVQQRIGRAGAPFGLLKFATMLKDSPNMGPGTVTEKNDPRVLPFGKFLRKTKLNEVPQFLNVLKGDISLVGPRPLTAQTFGYYPPDVQEKVVEVMPGLTGVGSIIFRDEEGLIARLGKPPVQCHQEYIAPYKGQLELWYIAHRGLWLDLKIIFMTVLAVLGAGEALARKVLGGLPPSPFEDLM